MIQPGNNMKAVNNSNAVREVAFSIINIRIIHITNQIFNTTTFFDGNRKKIMICGCFPPVRKYDARIKTGLVKWKN